ncbi:MAG: hypothetical protein LBD07_02525 [Spirochaetaceae bacterium]|jgi:hypothetical protein|nr:hypothetical protein [Spirochaetaceae bacterium]
MKWNWTKFLTKITSRKFWVWITTTAVTYAVLKGEYSWITPVVIVWGVISFIYLCGEVIIDALGKAIEKADIGLQIGGK